MKPFIAHSNGEALVPDEPLELPRGTKYRVTLEPIEDDAESELSLHELALRACAKIKADYPSDLARNHDHYLYGSPKRK